MLSADLSDGWDKPRHDQVEVAARFARVTGRCQ